MGKRIEDGKVRFCQRHIIIPEEDLNKLKAGKEVTSPYLCYTVANTPTFEPGKFILNRFGNPRCVENDCDDSCNPARIRRLRRFCRSMQRVSELIKKEGPEKVQSVFDQVLDSMEKP